MDTLGVQMRDGGLWRLLEERLDVNLRWLIALELEKWRLSSTLNQTKCWYLLSLTHVIKVKLCLHLLLLLKELVCCLTHYWAHRN